MLDKYTEEVLEFIWSIDERGEPVDKTRVTSEANLKDTVRCLDELTEQGLIKIVGSNITMTKEGEELGRRVVRRQRLAECLLSNVLDLAREYWEDTACEFEHILSKEVAESICTFLGHPPLCPHGKPIPRGECCNRLTKDLKPLVQNISEFSPGEKGRIVFIAPKHHDRLDKLGSFGLMPGTMIKLHQKQPTYVLDIGETSIAIDYDIAKDIYVKKIPK